MHAHLEIVMPPTDDVDGAIASIMESFSENGSGNSYPFWDWYVIGGRWSGSKLQSQLDPEKILEFYTWLNEEKVTVSGVVCGKETLYPEDQIEKVDAKWNEMFPHPDGPLPCPLFRHSGTSMPLDICRLDEIDHDKVSCERVIIAIPGFNNVTLEWDDYDSPKAEHMISTKMWNGVSHVPVDWDGKVSSAIQAYEDCRHSKHPEVTGNWLLATVDYHS